MNKTAQIVKQGRELKKEILSNQSDYSDQLKFKSKLPEVSSNGVRNSRLSSTQVTFTQKFEKETK